ncbi:MAG: DUF1512 domain-containing protein [Desulfurococcales archaeon]|nr:DUF1512 domain-containing protein [Desulfurococcales archaeon]
MTNGMDWTSVLFAVLILGSYLLSFTDLPQRMQLWRYSSFIRKKILQLTELEEDSKRKAVKYLKKVGVPNPTGVLNGFINNFFLISPVDLEPTDIIKRLRHLLRGRDESIRHYVKSTVPAKDEATLQNAEVMMEIASALTLINKTVKHYYKLGLKYNNWVLMMQLALELHQIVSLAKSYDDAMDSFMKGVPIGDGAGPLLVHYLKGDTDPEEIVKETVLYKTELEGRKLYLIKAKGPGSTVGYPGEAVEKVVEMLNGEVAKIITVDAALKLESESTGEVAHGVGAAIGDPGPEKIAIERVAAKHGIPLEAVVIKMSNEEAITAMTHQIYEGVKKALEVVKRIIKDTVKEGEAIVIAGIGNTVGIA